MSLLLILLFIYKKYKGKNKETTEEETQKEELYEKIIKILEEKQIKLYLYAICQNKKKYLKF